MAPSLWLNRPHTRPQTDEVFDPAAEMQWWYFDARLDDGSRLVTFFVPKTFGLIEGRPMGDGMVNVVLRRPDGETIRENRFFTPRERSASPTRLEIAFGDECKLVYLPGGGKRGLGRYRLRAKIDRLAYDFEIHPEIPPWTPFSSKTGRAPSWMPKLLRASPFSDDYFHYVPFVPRGRLEGELVVDGEALDVSGAAYHEQGRMNFPIWGFVPEWYWLHIEEPPWTILSGAFTGFPSQLKSVVDRPVGGFAFIQKGDDCLLAVFDIFGAAVRWDPIRKRDPRADDERRLAWETGMLFRRPGLSVRVDLTSKGVLEYVPFGRPDAPGRFQVWGQTAADARVEIRHWMKKERFETEAVLETMITGG